MLLTAVTALWWISLSSLCRNVCCRLYTHLYRPSPGLDPKLTNDLGIDVIFCVMLGIAYVGLKGLWA